MFVEASSSLVGFLLSQCLCTVCFLFCSVPIGTAHGFGWPGTGKGEVIEYRLKYSKIVCL